MCHKRARKVAMLPSVQRVMDTFQEHLGITISVSPIRRTTNFSELLMECSCDPESRLSEGSLVITVQQGHQIQMVVVRGKVWGPFLGLPSFGASRS